MEKKKEILSDALAVLGCLLISVGVGALVCVAAGLIAGGVCTVGIAFAISRGGGDGD